MHTCPIRRANRTSRKFITYSFFFLIAILLPAFNLSSSPSPVAVSSGVDINNPKVPHDVGAGSEATQLQLAQFAWQEFVALNWPSSFTAKNKERGRPSSKKSQNFTSVTSKNTQPLVWQTYKHRVEIFPMDTSNYDTKFDSVPTYKYGGVAGDKICPCTETGFNPNGIPLSKLNSDNGYRNYFNNLDETTEINLATLFVTSDPNDRKPLGPYMSQHNPGRRFLYQAKANADMFNFIAKEKFYEMDRRWQAGQSTFTAVTTGTAAGVAPCPDSPDPIICFPPGDWKTEGAIEVKATWRQLTLKEYHSGRYFVAPVIRFFNYDLNKPDAFCYQIVPDTPTAHTLPYGLVGLHIIHKTTSFPTFVFATFEQVDNLDRTKLNNKLFYNNRNSGIVNPNRQYISTRANPISDAVIKLNGQVQQQIRTANPKSVWQYYQLIGVQGKAGNYADNIDYFLANIVTETNEALRSFSGSLDTNNGTTNPKATNIFKYEPSKGVLNTFIGGGCKGCHGNTQAGLPSPPGYTPVGKGSFDFSFITADAPFDGVPDAVNQPLHK